MIFIGLLILTTLSIAGAAAFFSVYGLAQIFTGAFWPVVFMGGALEAGKLMAASYIYRYWSHVSFWFKTYILTAILVLMFITSIGIFGFLSAAYQKDIAPLAEMETKIELIEQKITDLEELRSDDRIQLQQLQTDKAKEIAGLPANFATRKDQVAQRYAERIKSVEDNIAAYTLQIQAAGEEKRDLKLTTLDQELKTGPIIFIAEAFGQEVNNATKWLILIIIFAFDPLAVALTVGANIALLERSKHKRRRKDDHDDMISDDIQPPTITNDTPIEDIRQMVEEMSHRELSPAEVLQKNMMEELLRRKEVTERVRNQNKED